jgi:hypothetical protein
MIIGPTLTHSQTKRSMQAHSPAESGSFGVLARRLRLVGADARAPPGPTSTGVRPGRIPSRTQPLR